MKSRIVAAVLAFTLGVLGAHRFYLRDAGGGIFYLIMFFVFSRIAFPFTFLLAMFEGFRFLMMSDDDFDRKYNRRKYYQREVINRERKRTRQRYKVEERAQRSNRPARTITRRKSRKPNPFKKSGIQKYKEYDMAGAIDDFKKGLEIEPTDAALHFNLACAYSLTEQKDLAYQELSLSVKYGLKDQKRILTHDDLAFVRIQPEFEAFQANGYQWPIAGQKPINTAQTNTDDKLLSQLQKLQELRKKGLLTEREFAQEKSKLLQR